MERPSNIAVLFGFLVKFLYACTWLAVVGSVYGQDRSYRIYGDVSDQQTGENIPLVNIFLEGKSRGTVTNEIGEFEIKVDSLPVILLFSHVGYQRFEQLVTTNEAALNIKLETAFLDSVTVQARDQSKLYSILDRALNRTEQRARKSHCGRAFYRQLSTNDEVYTELYEIFYDTRFSANGITDWALQEGRYALIDAASSEQYVFNRNFTLIDRIIPTVQPEVDIFITPLRDRAIDYYDLATLRIINRNDRQIAVISFRSIPESVGQTPALEGELFIDLNTYDIIKLSGKFHSKELEIVAFNIEGGTVADYVLSYEISFKHTEDQALVEYIKSGQNLVVDYVDRPSRTVQTNALLTYYEYYQPVRRNRRLGGRLRYERSDQALIDRVGYDPEFWKDNPIVKRTPLEDEVIASFEKNRQFGSIFLNNKNQVSLMPELDSDPLVKNIQRSLKRAYPPQEKVFLHLDKPWYAKREDIWFKLYVVEGAFHRPLALSGFATVELIDPKGELVASNRVEILPEGVGSGDFEIGEDFYSGIYLIRAYTDRMANLDPGFFFAQKVAIHNDRELDTVAMATDNFDLTFFPEGGDMVVGLPSQLAFKAIDETGEGIALSGTLTDSNGTVVAPIQTGPHGMGSTFFTPSPGMEYRAEVSYRGNNKVLDIRPPRKMGYVLSVSNRQDKNILVRILGSPDVEDHQIYLIGQARGQIYYKGKGRIQRRILTFEVPRNLIPEGISHLTLMDSAARPLRERLIFVDQNKDMDVTVKPSRKQYRPREEAELEISLTDELGQPVTGEFSVSVTDGGQIKVPDHWRNIRSYLLLSSDLRGSIDPTDLFSDEADPNRERALDLVMLTNGWRRFRWEDVLDSSSQVHAPKFLKGFNICGELQEKDKSLYGSSILSLLVMGTGAIYTTRAEQGEFCFQDVLFTDTTSIIIQTISSQGPSVNLAVLLEPPSSVSVDWQCLRRLFTTAENRRHLQLNDLRVKEEVLHGEDFELLREVVVKEQALQVKAEQEQNSTLYGVPDAVIDFGDSEIGYPDLISAMRGKIPGLQVTDDGFSSKIRLTGGTGDPLVIVDGIPINNRPTVTISSAPAASQGGPPEAPPATGGQVVSSAESPTNIYHVLRGYSPSQIDRIEVLKGGSAAMYGVRGGNGVLIVYTKDATSLFASTLDKQVYQGLTVPREFYQPKYASIKQMEVGVDRRSTLHWEPHLVPDERGRAVTRFYNSDVATGFNVVVQGLSKQGQLAYENFTLDFAD